jgi:hypothetical protein
VIVNQSMARPEFIGQNWELFLPQVLCTYTLAARALWRLYPAILSDVPNRQIGSPFFFWDFIHPAFRSANAACCKLASQ